QGENLASIPSCVKRQRARLKVIYGNLVKKKNLVVQGSAEAPSAEEVERREKTVTKFGRRVPDLNLRQRPSEA
ncbi:MAG: hypothetical protein JW883_10245, partial [Deltaproteobacteria bacterium]|nr:hypothetical protein [Deltaproteobacteria bacterium]